MSEEPNFDNEKERAEYEKRFNCRIIDTAQGRVIMEREPKITYEKYVERTFRSYRENAWGMMWADVMSGRVKQRMAEEQP